LKDFIIVSPKRKHQLERILTNKDHLIIMIKEETKSKIIAWHTRSSNENDPFIRFICEYLCLVAFLTHMYPQYYSDGPKIKRFLDNLKYQQENSQINERESQIVQKFHNKLDQRKLSNHISYLKVYPLKYKLINRRLILLCINDLDDNYNMIKYLQYVRNNLFHEIKDPEGDRDKHIIEIGVDIITPFIESSNEYFRIYD